MENIAKTWAGPVAPCDIQTLLDEHAITQLAKIYALGIDLRDYDLCRSAFAPDAIGILRDKEMAIEAYLEATYGVGVSYHATQHLIAQQHVRINGDDADLWSYGVAHHKRARGESRDEMIVGVQYRDRCKRFPKGWLIVERRTHSQWLDIGPAREPTPTS